MQFDNRCAHALKSSFVLKEVFDIRKDLVILSLSLQASTSTNIVAALVEYEARGSDMKCLAQGPYLSMVLLQR